MWPKPVIRDKFTALNTFIILKKQRLKERKSDNDRGVNYPFYAK